MLKFYYGTELEKLANQLFADLKKNPQKNPLAKEIFVVQNHGIGQWLALQMAEKEGIAANLKFEFPSERIWSLIRQLNSDIPQILPSNRGPMTWTLMQLFGDEAFLSAFPNLDHYIEEEDADRRAMRGWKLATKIADVFDQYLIYRPDMVLDWEQNRLNTQSVDAEKWQMQLWNRLTEYWGQHYDGGALHRTQLLNELWKALDKNEIDADALPEHISVFGVSSASRAFIKTMVKLSKIIDVRFYQLAVDPRITESADFQHPLLQSLGQHGANFMATIQESDDIEFESVGEPDPPSESLFAKLQSDLKTNSESTDSPSADNTIQVHNCHSPMREVEVLYDRLLDLLDKNPEISPEQILIMTPDIEQYAPVIEAVFGTPDEGQPPIPYAIADRNVRGGNPATETFLNILELCESRFKVTDVLDLMDTQPIREVFGFSDDDLNRIEQWVSDNRVRWGVDGPDKQRMGLPESDHFTWQGALRRILLGYMMCPSKDKLYDDIFAYNEVESSDDADLAGRLSFFLNKLFEIHDAIDGPRSVSNWHQLLDSIADEFLPDSRDYFWELNSIREGITALNEQAELVSFDRQLSFSIIRRWLKERLTKQSAGGGRIGRGIIFSSLMPMRSIPFKIIGMIGMNEDAFPGSAIPIEFDLMHLDSRIGDPVTSEEERFLFLENMLSARTHLYLSYVGQSNRHDADYPPSVVLNELLEYLKERYSIKPKDFITRHRLQGFSQKYFTGDGLSSYSDLQKRVSEWLVHQKEGDILFFADPLPEPDEEWQQLTARDLISFFQHPSKFLLRNRLGIYLREEDVLTDDREPFTLDRLSEYQIKQELLERYLKKQPLEEFRKVMDARDMLPEGWTGEREYRQNTEEVREFGQEIQLRLEDQQPDNVEVDLEINRFRIVGKLENIYPQAQLNYRFGKAKPKYLVDFWIRHLLFQLTKSPDHSGRSKYFSWDRKFKEKELPAVDDAEQILSELLGLYRSGLRKPLEFYCRSSYSFAEEVYIKNKEEDEGISKAEKKWSKSRYSPGEGDDPYYKVVTAGKEPFGRAFVETARTVWEPYFEAINKGDN